MEGGGRSEHDARQARSDQLLEYPFGVGNKSHSVEYITHFSPHASTIAVVPDGQKTSEIYACKTRIISNERRSEHNLLTTVTTTRLLITTADWYLMHCAVNFVSLVSEQQAN